MEAIDPRARPGESVCGNGYSPSGYLRASNTCNEMRIGDSGSHHRECNGRASGVTRAHRHRMVVCQRPPTVYARVRHRIG